MPMNNWEQVRTVVEQVLRQQRVTSRDHNGDMCFLTAYQIAVLIDKLNPTLKGDMAIGGKDEGGNGKRSFSQQIAWHLSHDVNNGGFDDTIEMRFFSRAGLDAFIFGGGNEPSANEFSMFRLKK